MFYSKSLSKMNCFLPFATLILLRAITEGGSSKPSGRFTSQSETSSAVPTQAGNINFPAMSEDTTVWASPLAEEETNIKMANKKNDDNDDDDGSQSGSSSISSPEVTPWNTLRRKMAIRRSPSWARSPTMYLNDDNSIATINHSSNLIDHLQELLHNSNSSDIMLKVYTGNSDEVKVFHTHHLLLILQSDVFEDLLLNQSVTTLTLRETAECAALFDKLLRYLYCGKITVLMNQVVPLHKLASKYHVSALQQGIIMYMSQQLASASPRGHVVSWYHYSLRIGDEDLQERCKQFLAWNMSTVIHSKEWQTISDDLMISLLQRSDLVVENELEIYYGVEEWIKRNQPDIMVAETVLKLIRYTMISPQHLFHIQKKSSVMNEHYKSIHNLLFLAFQFHSATPPVFAKYFDVNCSLFIPRNYLSSSWGSQWVINNPARDDRSTSFQTQLAPSNYDVGKKVTWNALFSPRWLPVSMRPSSYSGYRAAFNPEDSRPRIIITPATNSVSFAGVNFQKTILVRVKQDSRSYVKHVYDFHQSTEETGDFLLQADLQKPSSEYLVDNSLYLHIIIKPIYQSLIKTIK
ncbi:BTB/POZ domain-containing protein 17-like [Carcharodon carcharias]|uniref:BTB/POZ domain-containing protein 17-like n=1 Tax=Carcharodon carcharias TaxID=13397 RepID=UPI001B7F5953|nr:BTB/POZ domain-containing protein 17-like [Carcharodon carcharias]